MVDSLSSVAQSPYKVSANDATNANSGTLGKEDFMKLLIAQLSHQDPLEPTDPTQFVTQLSQFSSLEQLVNIKSGLDILALTQTAGTSAQMVSFIGKTVEFDGVGVPWKEGQDPVASHYRLASDADKVTVKITDSEGTVVDTIELGPRNAGTQDYVFDGKKQDGTVLESDTYSVEISAKDVDGNSVPVTQTSSGVVTGVTFAAGYPQLVLADGRTIGLAQVTQILEQAAAAAAATTPTTTATPQPTTNTATTPEAASPPHTGADTPSTEPVSHPGTSAE